MKLLIDHNNEIIFKTTKSIEQVKLYLEELYDNDITKLIDILVGIDEIDIYNYCAIDYDHKQLYIYGDDGIITVEILELSKINKL